jgi:hypothetical protein
MGICRKVRILALFVFGSALFSLCALGQDMKAPGPPPYCKPCLFYAGDFNSNNPKANGVANENVVDQSVPAFLEVPFVVPKGQTWFTVGAFVNQLANVSLVDPALTPWVIYTEIREQKVVCSGQDSGTFTPTGRSGFNLTEYTLLVKPVYCKLPAGRYWLQLVPQCTNQNDSSCPGAEYFESDVEDQPPLNSYGPLEPWDASVACGEICGPAWGEDGPCAGNGCDRFSVGILGYKERDSVGDGNR